MTVPIGLLSDVLQALARAAAAEYGRNPTRELTGNLVALLLELTEIITEADVRNHVIRTINELEGMYDEENPLPDLPAG